MKKKYNLTLSHFYYILTYIQLQEKEAGKSFRQFSGKSRRILPASSEPVGAAAAVRSESMGCWRAPCLAFIFLHLLRYDAYPSLFPWKGQINSNFCTASTGSGIEPVERGFFIDSNREPSALMRYFLWSSRFMKNYRNNLLSPLSSYPLRSCCFPAFCWRASPKNVSCRTWRHTSRRESW